jgi:hypothetical protein
MKLAFSRHIFEKKSSNIKFHQNVYSGSQVVPCGQTDMTKLIVTTRNFESAPETDSGQRTPWVGAYCAMQCFGS